MAIRRTLKQKLKTQERRSEITYQFDAAGVVPEQLTSTKGAKTSRVEPTPDLFGYPVTLIYGDMLKTVVVALIIVVALVAITLSGRFS
jgi:predicted phage tail protein